MPNTYVHTLNPLTGSNPVATSVRLESPLPELPLNAVRGSGQGVFRILNQQDGDKRIVWNKQSLVEISDAKKLFDDLIEKGFVPYEVSSTGARTATPMAEFNPEAEEVIFAPMRQMVAG